MTDEPKQPEPDRGRKGAIILVLACVVLVLLARRSDTLCVWYYSWRVDNEIGAAREPSMNALAAIGAPAVPELRLMLASERGETRSAAAAVLGRIPGPEALEALVDALEAPYEDARRLAGEQLRHVDTPEVHKALAQVLGTAKAGDARMAAILGLLGTGEATALPAIRAALDDPRADIRRMAVFALAGYPPDVAIPELIASLDAGDDAVKSEIASRLADHDPRKVLTMLFEKLVAGEVPVDGARAVVSIIADEDPGADRDAILEWWRANRGRLEPVEAGN